MSRAWGSTFYFFVEIFFRPANAVNKCRDMLTFLRNALVRRLLMLRYSRRTSMYPKDGVGWSLTKCFGWKIQWAAKDRYESL